MVQVEIQSKLLLMVQVHHEEQHQQRVEPLYHVYEIIFVVAVDELHDVDQQL
jgi:hypothetical protein